MDDFDSQDPVSLLKFNTLQHFHQYPPKPNHWLSNPNFDETKVQIIELVDAAINQAEDLEVIRYPSSTEDNFQFERGYGLQLIEDPFCCDFSRCSNEERFDKFVFVLTSIAEGLKQDRRTNKRDLYYQNAQHFSNQTELDDIVCKIVSMFGIPRPLLGIAATSKGLVAGSLQFYTENGTPTDCELTEVGVQIPEQIYACYGFATRAKFILVVEKDTVFQRISQECSRAGCFTDVVLVTGKGVPDVATRRFVHDLCVRFSLPVLILTDCDPYGIEIMLTYRYGSRSMALCRETLAVPSAFWLGILPSDIQTMEVPVDLQIPLSRADDKKLRDIYRRGYVQSMKSLTEEIEILDRLRHKIEIEQVAELPGFSVLDYVLLKIQTLEII